MRALVVDDDAFNLKILDRDLRRDGYEVRLARDGIEALAVLEQEDDFDVVLLDRMMPVMDGMQFLEKLRESGRAEQLPVVMQTAAAATEQVLEGIQAGVFYYLTKPFDKALMLSVVRRAVDHYSRLRGVNQDAQEYRDFAHRVREGFGLVRRCSMKFRTLADVQWAAFTIAQCFPDPTKASFGLHEMMLNAVEHGNLNITYQDKTQLILNGRWEEEIQLRLGQDAYEDRYAMAHYQRTENGHEVLIEDAGNGFDFDAYLHLSTERAKDPHGRGIYTARTMAFDELEYVGTGNRVYCRTVNP